MKRTILIIAGVALAAVLMVGCSTPDESGGVNAINADRGGAGLAPLAQNTNLIAKAQKWARHLADVSGGQCSMATLVHSDLHDGAPQGWRRVGENVGCRIAPGDIPSFIGPLQQAFMNSEDHRKNIMHADYSHVGVGLASAPAAVGNGWVVVYEAQEFARL
jgi:uncharacterized protein YkwD